MKIKVFGQEEIFPWKVTAVSIVDKDGAPNICVITDEGLKFFKFRMSIEELKECWSSEEYQKAHSEDQADRIEATIKYRASSEEERKNHPWWPAYPYPKSEAVTEKYAEMNLRKHYEEIVAQMEGSSNNDEKVDTV